MKLQSIKESPSLALAWFYWDFKINPLLPDSGKWWELVIMAQAKKEQSK